MKDYFLIIILILFLSYTNQYLIAGGDHVVLEIVVGNPLERKQPVEIMRTLPAWFTTNDVIDLDGLEIRYNSVNNSLYLFKKTELGPKQVTVFRPILKDVWTIPQYDLDKLRQRIESVVASLVKIQDVEQNAKTERDHDVVAWILFTSGFSVRNPESFQQTLNSIERAKKNHVLTSAGTGEPDISNLEKDHEIIDVLTNCLARIEPMVKKFESDRVAALSEWREKVEEWNNRPVIKIELKGLKIGW